MDTNYHKRLDNLDGKTLAFRGTPKDVGPDDSLVRASIALADSVVALDQGLGAVNKGLPITQQREQVSGLHAAVQIKLAAITKTITTATAKLEADEHRLTHPPQASAVAEVMLDVELRQWFAQADTKPIWEGMGRGEHPEMLAALARFGIGPTAQRAGQVFASLARDANPGKVQAFDREHERLTWAKTVIGVVSDVLNHSTNQLGPSLLIESEAVPA